MDITNQTQKPLSVPLPGGKKLFLGPGKSAPVKDKALTHPALVKLLDAGDIKSSEGSSKRHEGGTTKTGMLPGARHNGTGAMRQSGDR